MQLSLSAAERARGCWRAPGSAMSALQGHPSWPSESAGGQAAAQTGHLQYSSAVSGLTMTPISRQSLQQVANQCAGFKPPPGTARVLKKHQLECRLQPHVVRGLMELSAMLGATCSKANSDFRPGRHHTEADQVLHTLFLRPRARRHRRSASLCSVRACQLHAAG